MRINNTSALVTGGASGLGEATARALRAAGAEIFLEVGPGKVLTGLLRQIDRSLKCMPVEDPASLEKALVELAD